MYFIIEPIYDHIFFQQQGFNFAKKSKALSLIMALTLRDVLLLVLAWTLVTQIGVGARNWNWSTNQELELEKERKLMTKPAIFQSQSNSKPGYHWAILRTNNLTKKYTGASMAATVYNPQVSGDQYSACRVKVQNGEEYIETGWMVNEALFNDTLTHFYIYTKTKMVECFNTLCSGFVLVRQDNAPGDPFDKTSVTGGSIFETTFSIEKDQSNGNWYLGLGPSKEIIGWWPKNIFSGGLADAANSIDWGGEVFSPSNEPSPAMGSGQMSQDFLVINKNAFCRKITLSNENYVMENAAVAGTETFRDTPSKFYDVNDKGVVQADFYRLVYFGGPGQFIGK